MKRVFLLAMVLNVSYLGLHAQTWYGSSLDGDTYRNGNVGIGTSSPSAELEIKSVSGNSSELHINTTSDKGVSIIRFQDQSQNTYGFLANYPSAGKFSLYNYQSGSEAFIILPNNNIGIGTKLPNEKLALGNGNMEFETATNSKHLWGEEIQTIDFAYRRDDAPQAKIAKIALKNYNTDGTGWYHFTDRYDAGLSFYTCNNNDLSERMTLTHKGNVGIGTTTPDYPLDVEGTIRAHEIKVNLDEGADFVFEEDYNLMPLKELESFVKTQKHLPEVAPAKEMEAEGLSLSEMNIKLLQKIEELTLYVIELNEEIDTLKKEIKTKE